MRWFIVLLFTFLAVAPAHAQSPDSAAQKIDALSKLLADPEVQSWVKRETQPAVAPQPAQADISPIAAWETETRARINGIAGAVPRIPAEVWNAARRVREDAVSRGYAPVFVIFAGLIAVGLIGEGFYRRTRRAGSGFMVGILPVIVFALSMSVVFFAVNWPPLARIVLLVFLTAFVCFRLVSAVVAASDPPAGRLRIRLLAAIAILALASAITGPLIGLDERVVDAISYLFSIILLGLSLEAIWSVRTRSVSRRLLVMAAAVLVWVLWCLGFKGLFWIGIYVLILPGLLRAAGDATSNLAAQATGWRRVLVVRGVRAAIIVLAVAWLTIVWKMNPEGLAQRDPALSAIFYGLLKSVVVLLMADLLWHMAKFWIDNLLASGETAGQAPQEVARQGRLRTLLPILRNAIAAVGLTITALLVLAELGVQIGPLIAGAGVFGVAIGFGSQTLVKDIISGVFYMLDDAFRVGEYIQAKSYKGTVEGFSLRSVRLRHHRGPIFTVPFGELGAVENMSRDWGVVKFRISVSFDADLEVVRKLTKKIGATLAEDPEFEPLFIEPLKLKGVEEFGDYGLVLSFGMMLKPSPMQSFIRRRANLLLREAFIANGILFAQPMLQIGGDNAPKNQVVASP
ncbi:Small-conductance mechanosensitive channel [Rhizobium sp. NFR07]|uniref:mechanosensitive ion channel family protein n=1 Tax=Rhizobium sp. NFR07 TaxID=1566262 RepID=UPI0008F2C28F|nr:mechanosensitive ion channel family protein [Rhizobium sp. NFR07]SFA81843.1 Small-conductance mechanosensitive channel [Rhizobium sp. NFR07]